MTIDNSKTKAKQEMYNSVQIAHFSRKSKRILVFGAAGMVVCTGADNGLTGVIKSRNALIQYGSQWKW